MPPEPGLIEFLPPDERAFGTAADADGGTTFVGFDGQVWGGGDDGDADDDGPRSRWLPVLAGLALTSLLVGGVVAAAPWSGDDAAPTPTTIPAPATTLPAPEPLTTATVPPLDPSLTGWLLDPVPTGLRTAFLARSEDRVDQPSGWGEVWAEPGATRTSGRWFSLTLLPFREFDTDVPTWFPVDVDGRVGYASIDPDGVVSLAYDLGQTDATRLVTIDAGGFGLTALIDLASSIGIIDDRPQLVDDRPDFTDSELLDGLFQVASGPTDTDLTTRVILGGPPRTSAFYSGPGRFDITVVQQQPDDLLPAGADAATMAALAVTDVALGDGWGPQDGFRGEDLRIGRRTIGGYDLLVARWTIGTDGTDGTDRTDGTVPQVISLLTTRSLPDVLAMVPDVRLVSAEEWATADRGARSPDDPFDDDVRRPPGLTVGIGVAADGRDWTLLDWSSTDEWEVRVGTFASTVARPAATSVTPLTLDGLTLLAVRTDVAGATARVLSGDGVVRDVPLAATDPADQTSWSGVIAIESPAGLPAGLPVAFAVEVVGADGALVHRFAPWEPVTIAGGDG